MTIQKTILCWFLIALLLVPAGSALGQVSPASRSVNLSTTPPHEYLWFEAENMRGLATDQRGEPILNPSWLNLPKAKAPGWGINGPGVSAEWSQGGESEWNSAAASADETRGQIYQDIEVPHAGDYKVWVRYADWADKTETFVIRITQGTAGAGETTREVFRQEFGTKDAIDPHDEVSMYWGWAFAWDGAQAKLEKGSARISIEVDKTANARRHVDCMLLTNDLAYVPTGRRKPDFAAMRYLREWTKMRAPFSALSDTRAITDVPSAWQRPKIAGRDFFMPWNIAKEFWQLYDLPATERPLYPFSAEPIEQFVAKYKGAQQVPLFDSKLVVPVIYINDLPEYLKEGSPFIRYLRETKSPFGVLINYGTVQMSEEQGHAVWALLTGELRDQFLGWISGESIGYVYTTSAASDLKISPSMSRQELLEAQRVFYTNALDKKWNAIFHTPAGPMWDKLIPAQATSSTTYAHALAEWGVRLLGMETPAVQPMTAMRIAFTRGAARQFGGAFAYYHAPNFGDTATTFTKKQNFAGPDNFFHSRYGATMGPSLSWYRKSYYLYYMSGASAIYLEQGNDQFFKPGPGEHAFQLNPLGRITDEFMRFAVKHPDRGTPYTPVAFLLDPAHGWDMTDYPHWPFGVSQISRSDRALRELFGVAYFPGLVVEGEPATGDRQAFVSGTFGDIFDVIVASPGRSPTVSNVQSPTSKVQSPVPSRNAGDAGRQGDGETTAAETSDQASPLAIPASPRLPVPASPRHAVPASPRPRVSAPIPLPISPLDPYRVIVVGGDINWTPVRTGSGPGSPSGQPAGVCRKNKCANLESTTYENATVCKLLILRSSKYFSDRLAGGGGSDRVIAGMWPHRLTEYVRNGGTVVLNAAQVRGLPEQLLGIHLTNATAEADTARCLSPAEQPQDLSGQMFRYVRVELKGATTLIGTPGGDPLVTVNKLGKGSVVFNALPDLLGIDGRITPFAAHMLAHVFADATPVQVSGDAEYLLNRNARGWVVTLFNNNGVIKPQQGLAQVDRTAVVTATVTLPGQGIQSASDWISNRTLEIVKTNGQQNLSVKLPPGGVAVVELIVNK